MSLQVRWSDCPRSDGGEFSWTLTQTPVKGSLSVIVLSHNLTGCVVHFWSGRTLGCTGVDCEACEKNRAAFWEGYLAAVKRGSLERVIVRITEKIGGRIVAWQNNRHTLRGAVMEFDRPSRTPNGRIRLKIEETAVDVPEKLVEPDMQKVLCHIWRMNGVPRENLIGRQSVINGLQADKNSDGGLRLTAG